MKAFNNCRTLAFIQELAVDKDLLLVRRSPAGDGEIQLRRKIKEDMLVPRLRQK